MNITEGIFKRKSIRKFTDEEVKKEDIMTCLEAACDSK